MNEQWLLIGLLAIVVFGIRVIGLEWLGKRTFPPLLKRFFYYVPIGIMTALLVKHVLVSPDSTSLALSLPVLITCLGTGLSYFWTKRFLLSVVIGVVLGLAVRVGGL
ncbi:hypothetical protein JCM19046_180 [Bacillus sp. JCM 19046]|nr:hypothetical protein JCM19046_180 [Bacillus sp. JCM 19046]